MQVPGLVVNSRAVRQQDPLVNKVVGSLDLKMQTFLFCKSAYSILVVVFFDGSIKVLVQLQLTFFASQLHSNGCLSSGHLS